MKVLLRQLMISNIEDQCPIHLKIDRCNVSIFLVNEMHLHNRKFVYFCNLSSGFRSV